MLSNEEILSTPVPEDIMAALREEAEKRQPKKRSLLDIIEHREGNADESEQ